MSDSDFAQLRTQTLAMLKSAAGCAEMQHNMNLAARNGAMPSRWTRTASATCTGVHLR